METQTQLSGTVEQARELIEKLTDACKRVESGEMDLMHVRMILEQADARGPWRLILSICGGNE